MRIISGTHKGRQIHPPANLPVRPTTDFAKTGLFNILNNYYDLGGVTVLDLFCGTGNISFEFASRGATGIVAVDGHQGCIDFIMKTSSALQFNTIKSVKSEVTGYLNRCEQKFDIIFADPPYEIKGIELIPEIIFQRKLLNDGGVFVLEHGAQTDFYGNSHFVERRTYGHVNFSFFKSLI